MVRLKGYKICKSEIVTNISIPYGAIKSLQAFLVCFPRYHISIPYGAIKSITIKKEIFLIKEISIPYGAIKSHYSLHR